jgi:DnaJ homolog subfamily A member 2
MYDIGGFDPGVGSMPNSGFDADMEEMMARVFAGMGTSGGGFAFGASGFGVPPASAGAKRGRDGRGGKGKGEVQEYEITLEELYKGKTTRFAATKTVICAHCKGTGGKEKAKKIQCGSCRGQGSCHTSFASSFILL